MIKKLNIDLYLDGYDYSQVSCIELPLAAASGNFFRVNYFYYCFYYALYNNYNVRNFDNDFIADINKKLNKLGLNLISYQINEGKNLINLIKKKINENVPIIFMTEYEALFWSKSYSMDSYVHAFLVSGYWKEEKIVIIRDPFIINQFSNKEIKSVIKSCPLYEFSITEDMIIDIYEKTLKLTDKVFIYSVESNNHTLELDIMDLIKDSIEYLKNNNDSLELVINDINKYDIKGMEDLRKLYYHSFILLFEILEKFYFNSNNLLDIKEKLLLLKHEYVEYKNICLYKICNKVTKNKNFKYDEKEKIIKTLRYFKDKFIKILLIMYDARVNNESININHYKNYFLNACVTADSEYEQFKALNAVNGRQEDWRYDLWASNYDNKHHWLKVDIGEPKAIIKFVVKHNSDKDYYITRDFEIQGSNDNVKWSTLVRMKDNKLGVTEHSVESCEFRYFRLYITKPCDNDFQAVIYEFEAWGSIE